jgi:hypothetical protein
MAVDNIGDNRHNKLLYLSIFMTARVARQTLHPIELVQNQPFQSNVENTTHAGEIESTIAGRLLSW